MKLIGRIIVIIFAVMVASIVAGMAIAMGVLGPEWHGFTGDIGERVGFWAVTFFGASFAGAAGLLPLAIFIAIAETFKIRSLLVNALAGVAMLLLGFYGNGFNHSEDESIDSPPPPISREAEIAAAAGAAFGFAYWAIAGRNAGRWRERRQPTA